jgi:hemolysin activation/secretion protein
LVEWSRRSPGRQHLLRSLLGPLAAGVSLLATPTFLQAQALPVPVSPSPAAAAPVAAPPSVEVVLTAVNIGGATRLTPGELEPAYREFVGRVVRREEIEQIVARITAAYREAGFFLSHAVAPPQSLAGGVVNIEVIEGYIDRVSVRGLSPNLETGVRGFTSALEAERPLRLSTLEGVILAVKDQPGIVIRPSVAPIDEAAGSYELIVNAEPKPILGFAAIDNRAPPYEGTWETQLSASLTSLAMPFDELTASFFTSPAHPRELTARGVAYQAPIGSTGVRIGAAATRSFIHPGDYLAFADLSGRTDAYQVNVSYPVLRTRDQSLFLSGSFNVIESRETVPEDVVFFDDHLRVLRADATYVGTDPGGGTTRAFAQVSQGLSVLGASRLQSGNLSTPNGHAAFTKITASISHERPLFGDFGMFVDIAGQRSWQPLLLSEEFSLGGSRFGRGYDQGELVGDDAVVGAVELRYGHGLDWPVLRAFQFYLFYDLGAVWNHDPDNVPRHATLASTGGGVRLTLERDILLSLEVARPLTLPLPPNFHKPVRAFVRLSKAF